MKAWTLDARSPSDARLPNSKTPGIITETCCMPYSRRFALLIQIQLTVS